LPAPGYDQLAERRFEFIPLWGFRTFRCLELPLYHSLAKLPEPESTHEFF
jgi:hypothetical protein